MYYDKISDPGHNGASFGLLAVGRTPRTMKSLLVLSECILIRHQILVITESISLLAPYIISSLALSAVIASTCQAPGLTVPNRATASVGWWVGWRMEGAPMMGLRKPGSPPHSPAHPPLDA